MTAECLIYGYALSLIGLLKEAEASRNSTFRILLDMGLEGCAFNLIVEHEKKRHSSNSLSEENIEAIRERFVDGLSDIGIVIIDFFEAEENGIANSETILSNYFIEQVGLDKEGSLLPVDIRKKISSLTREDIDRLAGLAKN